METLRISDIALACGSRCDSDVVATGVVIDNRQVKKGDVFIAIEGENHDGHIFAKSAVEAGAVAVICHKEVDVDCPKILVKNTGKALVDLAKWYRTLFDVHTVGVTGSVGKTTTKEMIWAVMSQKYNTLKNEGNRNNEIGMPLSVLNLSKSHEAAVFEMGINTIGDIERLTLIATPSIGVISNIGVAHIENVGSREKLLETKMELVKGMPKGAPLILCKDNDLLRTVRLDDRPIIYYSLNEDADYTAENIRIDGEKTYFDICYSGGRQSVELPAIGDHNVQNALAAFAVGMLLGVTPELAAEGLNKYVPSGMRQKIVHKNGITVVEDCYNASTDSMKAAIAALSKIKADRRILVIGDMLELGEFSYDAHYEVGVAAAKSDADLIYAYGKEAEIYAKAVAANGRNAELFTDKTKLAQELIGKLREGDAILFKASRGLKLEEVIYSIYDRWENK
ncbi:MAG: UDP-N-acetylmuramoyl-tripeptide--D-alanyl-D-alanine ligase [Clostridia bacterium]|nr:UDP-N-acetylmuramoyl-tripeptide--D-alanyl-D-alanine ligase [Clostridia bacterium]